MPKSKRNKQVELTKTAKHGMEGKKKLYREIQASVEHYSHLFIFSVTDMRNSKIKSVREKWKHSRFFIGKNKVMALALGNTPEKEFRPNLHKISERLKGERGLLFSNQPAEEVLKWFNSYSEGDYARSGNHATETVILREGPLKEFTHSVEPYLRQLGLPTTLKKGVIHLVQDHTVCNEGDVLTPESAKILKLLGHQMAEFMIKIECVWSKDGSFRNLLPDAEPKENTARNSKKIFEEVKSDDDTPMDVVEKIDSDDDEDIPEVDSKVEDKFKNGEGENIKTGSTSVIESMEEEENMDDNDKELDTLKEDDSDEEEIPILVAINGSENVDSAAVIKSEKEKHTKTASKKIDVSSISSTRVLRKRPDKTVEAKK